MLRALKQIPGAAFVYDENNEPLRFLVNLSTVIKAKSSTSDEVPLDTDKKTE